jgi:hypothetical protein
LSGPFAFSLSFSLILPFPDGTALRGAPGGRPHPGFALTPSAFVTTAFFLESTVGAFPSSDFAFVGAFAVVEPEEVDPVTAFDAGVFASRTLS